MVLYVCVYTRACMYVCDIIMCIRMSMCVCVYILILTVPYSDVVCDE